MYSDSCNLQQFGSLIFYYIDILCISGLDTIVLFIIPWMTQNFVMMIEPSSQKESFQNNK